MIQSTFFDNPILRRELSDRLRSPKTLAAMIAVALLSSVLVLMRWPTDASIDLVSQGAFQVFRPVAFAIATAIMMLIPAFPATAIVTERRRGTLTLLLNSPTTPLQIYLGKLCGNVLLSLIIFSVSLPALMACFAMGGIFHLEPRWRARACLVRNGSSVLRFGTLDQRSLSVG